MKNLLRPVVLAIAVSVSVLGAALTVDARTKQPEVKVDPALPKELFLKSAPQTPSSGAPAQSPLEAKKSAKVGDEIVLSGRVGGSKVPFVAGRSMLTVVGDALPACSDNPDDHCKAPWDYCCESKVDIAKHSATVQVVDDKGKVLRVDLKGQGGLTELSDLMVVGKVAQVSDKLLVVNATGIYVNPSLPHGFFVRSLPAGARAVTEVRATGKVGERVTITGRIGGRTEPFDGASASFTLVGAEIAPCDDKGTNACKRPWDYCQRNKDDLAKHLATVQVVDGQGKALAMTLRGRNGLDLLSEVTVTGTILRADERGLVISATGLFVSPRP